MVDRRSINEPKLIKELFQKLIKSDFQSFPKQGKINVTNDHGVYIIFSPNDQVLHVGTTTSGKNGLNQRLYNHISCAGVFYAKYLKPKKINMRGTHKFKYLIVHDARQRMLLEAYSAGVLCPLHLGTAEKIKLAEFI